MEDLKKEVRHLWGDILDSETAEKLTFGKEQRELRWRNTLNHYLTLSYPLEDAVELADTATDGRPTIYWRS